MCLLHSFDALRLCSKRLDFAEVKLWIGSDEDFFDDDDDVCVNCTGGGIGGSVSGVGGKGGD